MVSIARFVVALMEVSAVEMYIIQNLSRGGSFELALTASAGAAQRTSRPFY